MKKRSVVLAVGLALLVADSATASSGPGLPDVHAPSLPPVPTVQVQSEPSVPHVPTVPPTPSVPKVPDQAAGPSAPRVPNGQAVSAPAPGRRDLPASPSRRPPG